MAECQAIQTLITNLAKAEVLPEDIGVITLYDGQRERLRGKLETKIEVKIYIRSKDERKSSL